MTLPAIFAIIVGLGMIAQWILSYLSKAIPELETEPIRIGFHIAAKMITTMCLVVAGMTMLANHDWGKSLFLVAMGMLIYTAIACQGNFAQQGKWARWGSLAR